MFCGFVSFLSSLSTHGSKVRGKDSGQSFCKGCPTAQTCVMISTMPSGSDSESFFDQGQLQQNKKPTRLKLQEKYLQVAQRTDWQESLRRLLLQTEFLSWTQRASGCVGGSPSPESGSQPVSEPSNQCKTNRLPVKGKEKAQSGGADISGHLFSASTTEDAEVSGRSPSSQVACDSGRGLDEPG